LRSMRDLGVRLRQPLLYTEFKKVHELGG